MQVALDMLGLGPCYHMFVCKEKHHASLWLEAEEAVREGKEFDFGKCAIATFTPSPNALVLSYMVLNLRKIA